jgi:hypothetical protein
MSPGNWHLADRVSESLGDEEYFHVEPETIDRLACEHSAS